MSTSNPIAAALERISAWFRAHAPEHAPVFAPPVVGQAGALEALFEATGGQTDNQDVFDFHCLLSPVDAARERDMMNELARSEPWPESWWHPSWVPFASDFAGQLLVVDERSGEVIGFIHDDEPREVLAPSLPAYFQQVATDLETGERVFDERFGVVWARDLERLVAARGQRHDRGAEPSQVGFFLAAAAFGLLVAALAYALDL